MTPMEYVTNRWTTSIRPALDAYIEIRNLTPSQFVGKTDDERDTMMGDLRRACTHLKTWCETQGVKGLTALMLEKPGKTPLLLVQIPGTGNRTVLFYGHYDKQPPSEGWAEGLAPYDPVVRDDRLYGRGGADDGYAVFAAMTAVMSLCEAGKNHPPITIAIEGSEESGSPDLPTYLDEIKKAAGNVALVIGLDSSCGDYLRLWTTTSLRGVVNGTLRVQTLREGIHSGMGGGIAPSSFDIACTLLDRVRDAKSGHILLSEFQTVPPAERLREIGTAARVLGDGLFTDIPWYEGTKPMHDVERAIIANTWGGSFEVTGADGLPSIGDASPTLRHMTALRISMRVPPTKSAKDAYEALKRELELTNRFNASVSFEGRASQGWHAPTMANWLENAIAGASMRHFGAEPCSMGVGGTIPFMSTLNTAFPGSEIWITGVLGPGSNAHGPNEFLHIPYTQKLMCAVADVVASVAPSGE